MPYSYQIDPHTGAIFSRGTGVVTAQDMLDGLSELFSEGAFSTPYRELFDMRAAERFKVYVQDARQILALSQTHMPKVRAARIALLTSQDHIFGIGRMIEILSESLPIQVKPFRDEQEARRWLGLSEQPRGKDQA